MPRATVYTLADSRFFIGLVALLNSLRLTGHDYPLVVLDCGLTDDQRMRLREHAAVVTLPPTLAERKILAKPYVHELHSGPEMLLWIDSDVIVTGALQPLVEYAETGRICAYPVESELRGRRFDEWEQMYELEAPLREQAYVNAGVFALSLESHRRLLERWEKACSRFPVGRIWHCGPQDAYWASDQDALNALLMSEVPPEAVAVLPAEEIGFPQDMERVDVVDRRTLACILDGRPVRLLHYTWVPKPWASFAWRRMRHPLRDAYIRLLPRLLFADDVPRLVSPTEVPPWLRPGAVGVVGRRTVGVARPLRLGAAKIVRRLPPPARDLVLALRDQIEPPER